METIDLTRQKGTKTFEQYRHHGELVWVNKELKGRHREHCLCFDCVHLEPGQKHNCKYAQELFEFCQKYGMVTPVFECKYFSLDHEMVQTIIK